MDTRLLQHYNIELDFMREMGNEFAHHFPKVAGRLGMERAGVGLALGVGHSVPLPYGVIQISKSIHRSRFH